MFSTKEVNNKKLQTLIERAWALHDRLNDEIENSISFCRFCSDRSFYCDISQTPFGERGRLIAIRGSLKEVENKLLHLQIFPGKFMFTTSWKTICAIIAIYMQKLQSWQLTDWHSGLSRLEQRRLFLIKQVTQYEGRPLDVVKEMSASFGNDNKSALDMNVGEITMKKNEVQTRSRRLSSFLICCIRMLFNPWKWQNAVGIAVKLILISASLSSTIQFYHTKQKPYNNSPKKIVTVLYSKEEEKLDTLLTISKIPLDVFCGMG